MFDEAKDKAKLIEVWDKVVKDVNPVWTINEEFIDGLLEVEGDQTVPSRDWLIAEDEQGNMIGFSCLFKSSKRDSWWMEIRVVPEYYRQELALDLFKSTLTLFNKKNSTKVLLTVRKFAFVDSPLQTRIKEMGLEPVHFNFWMYLVDIDSLPELIEPTDISFQKQKKISDYSNYLVIHNDAFRKLFEFRAYSEEDFRLMVNSEWAGYDVEHIFAFDGKICVGVCTVLINPEHQHIGVVDNLAVLHSYQQRGIGSFLLNLGIKTLLEKGCKRIELGVEANNEKAQNLYKKFGFNELESHTTIIYELNL